MTNRKETKARNKESTQIARKKRKKNEKERKKRKERERERERRGVRKKDMCMFILIL